jgi:hypothetical protein
VNNRPHLRAHSKNLKEIADDLDACGGLRLAAPAEAQIVFAGKRLVTSHVLVGAALGSELVVSVGRIRRAREATLLWRRRNPYQLI